MSACTRCGTMMVPGAPFCHQCGFQFAQPVSPVIVVPTPPLGTQKATVSTPPFGLVIGGVFFLIFAIFAGLASPFFGAFAVLAGLIGVVMIALGAMGVSLPQAQITYQSGASQGTGSAYDYTPKSFLKPCPRCGQEVPIAALACYHCGSVLP